MTPEHLTLALFGLWTLACLFLGAWLMHRKQTSLSPLPSLHDAERTLNWIRTGKTDPQAGDDPPPVDTPPVNFEL